MHFKVEHQDHGVSAEQYHFILDEVMHRVDGQGQFLLKVILPAQLGTVPCGLHGPIMGDAPIDDEDVVFYSRGGRAWTDRCVDRPTRPVSIVQVIGVLYEDQCVIHTIFGGPLAPMNPDDPKCSTPLESERFWSEHALTLPTEAEGATS